MTTPQIITIVLLILLFARDFTRGLITSIQAKIDERAKGVKVDDSVSALVVLTIITFLNSALVFASLSWSLIIGGFFGGKT